MERPFGRGPTTLLRVFVFCCFFVGFQGPDFFGGGIPRRWKWHHPVVSRSKLHFSTGKLYKQWYLGIDLERFGMRWINDWSSMRGVTYNEGTFNRLGDWSFVHFFEVSKDGILHTQTLTHWRVTRYHPLKKIYKGYSSPQTTRTFSFFRGYVCCRRF